MSSNFLTSPSQRQLAGITLFTCQFDAACFTEQSPGQLGLSLPAELSRAVAKRKAEFIAGRWAARQALKAINITSSQLAIGDKRAPIWPAGIEGAITHTNQFAAAAAQPKSQCPYLGIDAEVWLAEQQADEIGHQIAKPEEYHLLLADDHISQAQATTLLFSAKESLFKAIFPTVQQYLEFSGSLLTGVNWTKQSLELSFLQGAQFNLPTTFTAYFDCQEEMVLTLVK